MLEVGVTGGIGSGKTTVCRIFQSLGIPVYNADERAKWLSSNDPEVVEQIKLKFGGESFEDGSLNRSFLAEQVFSNKDKLAVLNAIVHPAVAKDYVDWVDSQKAPFVIKEAAILFESGSYKTCDYVILVSAPEEVRIERVVKRDGASREEVIARIKNQWPEEKKVELATGVITNDSEKPVIPQVVEWYQKFKD